MQPSSAKKPGKKKFNGTTIIKSPTYVDLSIFFLLLSSVVKHGSVPAILSVCSLVCIVFLLGLVR